MGIPIIKFINAPWTTCALSETNSTIKSINKRFGSVKPMWILFFKILKENSDVNDKWKKKIEKKVADQLKFVYGTLAPETLKRKKVQ